MSTKMLEKGMKWLSEQMRDHSGDTVQYTQYKGPTVEIQCALGRGVLEKEVAMGMVQQYDMLDFFVLGDDFETAFPGTIPQRGDEVRITLGGTMRVFTVMPPGGINTYRLSDPYDNDVFRYTDSHNAAYRIHTKFRRDEP